MKALRGLFTLLLVVGCVWASPPARAQDVTIEGLSATYGSTLVVLTWTVKAPANDYQISEVWRSTTGPDLATAMKIRISARDWYLDLDVPPRQTRWYWVRAANQSGTYGPYTGPVSTATP